MKTINDAIDIVWKQVNASLSSTITGGVYKLSRPFESSLEDVVVNALPITGETVQQCVINVNAYVPNLLLKIKGKQDSSMPDYARLKQISETVISLLHKKTGSNYWHYVENHAVIRNEGVNEHYANVRIRFMFTGED